MGFLSAKYDFSYMLLFFFAGLLLPVSGLGRHEIPEPAHFQLSQAGER